MDSQDRFYDLTQKYFGFLIEKHGFTYVSGKNMFDSLTVRISFEHVDYVTPSIKLWKKSEPKFTSIDITWMLRDFINYESIDKNLLEDNFAYLSKLFMNHVNELIYDPEILLIKGLKRVFLNKCRFSKINKKNFLSGLNTSPDLELRKYYYYLKNKDKLWDPSKEL